mgnify:FL=1|jgi:hypothetical protein
MNNIELFNDHFQNYKVYGIPKAQLIIADVPYNLGANAYASNPAWYVDGDNKNGESELAGKQFFGPDKIPAHAIVSGNKYPDIRDVVRYVEWQNATGSLFDDDTATSCMSYYGLCE